LLCSITINFYTDKEQENVLRIIKQIFDWGLLRSLDPKGEKGSDKETEAMVSENNPSQENVMKHYVSDDEYRRNFVNAWERFVARFLRSDDFIG